MCIIVLLDNVLFFLLFGQTVLIFSYKIRFPVSCKLSAKHDLHAVSSLIFSDKKKNAKKNKQKNQSKCHPLQV